MKNLLKKPMPRFNIMRKLWKRGYSINSIALVYKVPYGTLYRNFHGSSYGETRPKSYPGRKVGKCYFCEKNGRNVLSQFKKKGRSVYRHIPNVIHHIDCDRTNDSKRNLVELCERCHARLHSTIYRRLVEFGNLKVKNL